MKQHQSKVGKAGETHAVSPARPQGYGIAPNGIDALDQRIQKSRRVQGQRDLMQRVAAGKAGQVRGGSVTGGGMPRDLAEGIQRLSGVSMSGVQVHRNSGAPAQAGAAAFARGQEIHLAPGQERHLPHEAWHVVQQAQGRVQPRIEANGFAINNDAALEREADTMGAAAQRAGGHRAEMPRSARAIVQPKAAGVIQRNGDDPEKKTPPPPTMIFSREMIEAALNNPQFRQMAETARHMPPSPVYRMIRENPAVVRRYLPQVPPGAIVPIVARPAMPATAVRQPIVPPFLVDALWFLRTAASGVHETVTEDIGGGASRLGRRIGFSGPQARQQVSAEHDRVIGLFGRLITNPAAVCRRFSTIVVARLESDPQGRLRRLAEESGQEWMIKSGASHLAIKAAVRTPVKHLVTNPRLYPKYLKAAGELTLMTPKGMQAFITRTIESRLGTFLAKRQLTALVAAPVTLPLNAVMTLGFVERAFRASEKLKSLDPVLWKQLRAENLDLMAVLVEDLMEKMEKNKLQLLPPAPPLDQSRGGQGGGDGPGSSGGAPPVKV